MPQLPLDVLQLLRTFRAHTPKPAHAGRPTPFPVSPANRFFPEAGSEGAVCASPSLHWTQAGGWSSVRERLAVEAPLAIEIAYVRGRRELRKVLGVTMRTPGDDEELALGFLLAEGLIHGMDDVLECTTDSRDARGETVPTQRVRLAQAPREDLQRISRGLLTSSACGLCGRPSLDGLPMAPIPDSSLLNVSCEQIAELAMRLRENQSTFFATGGSHAAALSNADGEFLLTREDVGRHNAVDKLFGAALRLGVHRADKILVLSGRASFELVQKAAAAGVPIVVAIGAPSSFAVSLANAARVTLVGFARDGRFNVYAHADRLQLAPFTTADTRPTASRSCSSS